MIVPLLPPRAAKSPMLLEVPLPDGMRLMVGAVGRLTTERPGNGGTRIWSYESREAAAAEAVALAQGMEVKHLAYNTGCSGAKVTLPPQKPPGRPARAASPARRPAVPFRLCMVASRPGAVFAPGRDAASTTVPHATCRMPSLPRPLILRIR